MKPNQIDKLYSKLTPHEQAALCMEASARQDRVDFDAIADSVPRVTYQGSHLDYSQRLTGLYSLAGLYGTIYWKNRALMMIALHASDEPDGNEECAIAFAAKVASMNAALFDACQIFKVDINAIKKLADCEDQPTFSQYVDAEMIEQYTELFTKAVNFQ